jgi:hypothetical protein
MSIYDLKQSVGELTSANDATSRMSYEQHPPTRDVTNGNFPNGAIHIKFQCSGQKWWVPSRSYIRTTVSLTKTVAGVGAGQQLNLDDDVAPNMGLCSNLYQSAEFRVSSKTVSRVSDYMPQIDALETRLNKSKAWIDSLGNSTNFWQAKQEDRANQIVADPALKQKEQKTGRLALGFNALQQIVIAVDTGILTQTTNLDRSFVGIFSPGDKIEVVGPKGPMRYQVVGVIDADNLQLDDVKTLAVADAVRDFSRIRTVNADDVRGITTTELTWQPPLSIFKVGHAIPSGDFEFVLNPQTASQYKLRAIESLLGNKVPASGINANDYELNIEDVYLYVATVEGARMDNGTYLLDLNETRCQVDNVVQGAFQQKNFDVSPSTYALTACFQDERAGNDTRYSASKFKSGGVASNELLLNRLFINYAGQSKPNPDASPIFDALVDRTTQRYVESQINSGAYFDCGGAETIQEFHERGSYYYMSWPRDGTDRSTRVNVHFGFSAAPGNTRVLLFDHYKKVASITIADGNVTDVRVEDQ